MVTIELSDEEAESLRKALDNYLPELRYEMSRVKRERERHPVVLFEEALSALRRRL